MSLSDNFITLIQIVTKLVTKLVTKFYQTKKWLETEESNTRLPVYEAGQLTRAISPHYLNYNKKPPRS